MALLLAARSARCFARAPAVRPPSARAMSSSGSYDMEGTISKIGEVQTFESGFAKIEFVVTTEEMYPQEVKFAPRPRPAARVFRRGFRRGGETRAAAASAFPPPQDLFKDKIGLLDSYAVDDRVCVSFNIRGNEWQGRHYVNLQAWRLQNLAAGGGDGYASPPVALPAGMGVKEMIAAAKAKEEAAKAAKAAPPKAPAPKGGGSSKKAAPPAPEPPPAASSPGSVKERMAALNRASSHKSVAPPAPPKASPPKTSVAERMAAMQRRASEKAAPPAPSPRAPAPAPRKASRPPRRRRAAAEAKTPRQSGGIKARLAAMGGGVPMMGMPGLAPRGIPGMAGPAPPPRANAYDRVAARVDPARRRDGDVARGGRRRRGAREPWNDFVRVDEARAAATSRRLDAGARKDAPLFGVPFAAKANLCVAGETPTAGSAAVGGWVARADATAVARLADAGAVLVGSTNCDEFGMGSTGEASAHGATRRPSATPAVLRVIAGADGLDATCVDAPVEDYAGLLAAPANFRVAAVAEASDLADATPRRPRAAPPWRRRRVSALAARRLRGLLRAVGVRGLREPVALRPRGPAAHGRGLAASTTRPRLRAGCPAPRLGAHFLGDRHADGLYGRAEAVRDAVRRDLAALFRDYDAVLPVALTAAPPPRRWRAARAAAGGLAARGRRRAAPRRRDGAARRGGPRGAR
ncbi:hypothetical protein JL722_1035 [Aureococcus anophagefferens]|nr:hypothetical protein JL722_1035 [Aureococcus anophagefferens]